MHLFRSMLPVWLEKILPLTNTQVFLVQVRNREVTICNYCLCHILLELFLKSSTVFFLILCWDFNFSWIGEHIFKVSSSDLPGKGNLFKMRGPFSLKCIFKPKSREWSQANSTWAFLQWNVHISGRNYIRIFLFTNIIWSL